MTNVIDADRELFLKLFDLGEIVTREEVRAGNVDLAWRMEALASHRLNAETNLILRVDYPILEMLKSAYYSGAMDVHRAWIDGDQQSEPDFQEAASDYAASIDIKSQIKEPTQ